jgi:site-specific recombinase XerD
MATIHKRRLGSGKVVWELTHGTGRDRRRFVAGVTRAEAITVLRHFEQQIALHGEAPETVGVASALERYEVFLRGNRRPSSVRRYLRVLRTFHQCFLQPYHPDVDRLREVTPAHIESYKQRRHDGDIVERDTDADRQREQDLRTTQRERPHSKHRENSRYGWLGRKRLRRTVTARTINYELRVLATFFGWAIRNNLLSTNPAHHVERFRVPKQVLPKFMSSADLRAFCAACHESERRLFMAILLSGMRRGEIEYLTWDDVSFELGVILIRGKPDAGWQPKTDERVIPMSPILHDILLEQRGSGVRSRWVFPNREGGHDTHILEKMQKICRKAGIRRSTVHALRHSFGAHLRMAGVSLADIADLLGHKDIATTQIYAKVHQEHLRTAVAKLTHMVPERATASPKQIAGSPEPSTPKSRKS